MAQFRIAGTRNVKKRLLDFPGFSAQQGLSVSNITIFVLKTIFENEGRQQKFPSMTNHNLSKNAYLVKIIAAAQQITLSLKTLQYYNLTFFGPCLIV